MTWCYAQHDQIWQSFYMLLFQKWDSFTFSDPISLSDTVLAIDVIDCFFSCLDVLFWSLNCLKSWIPKLVLLFSSVTNDLPCLGKAELKIHTIFEIGAQNIKECEGISTNPSSLQEKQLNPHPLWVMGQQNVFQLKGQWYVAGDIIRFYGIKINTSTLQLKA